MMTSRNDPSGRAWTPAHAPPHPRRARLALLAAAAAVGATLAVACAGDDPAAEAGSATAAGTSSTTDAAGAGTAGTAGTTTDGGSGATATATTAGTGDDPTSAGDGTGSGGGDPALAALCLEVDGSIAAGLAGDCACAVGAGEYPSVDACLADRGITPDFGACRCEIVARAPAMAPYFACLKPVAADFAACIAALGCDDPDALDNCYFLLLGASECPPSIPAVDAEVEFVCRGASPFTCGSGEEIPDTWRCDLEDHCADASDEAGCPFFECESGDAIPLEWQCDGAADCPDGDDEVGCDP